MVLNTSVGQRVRWFWLQVSHEVTIKLSAEDVTKVGDLSPDGLLPWRGPEASIPCSWYLKPLHITQCLTLRTEEETLGVDTLPLCFVCLLGMIL